MQRYLGIHFDFRQGDCGSSRKVFFGLCLEGKYKRTNLLSPGVPNDCLVKMFVLVVANGGQVLGPANEGKSNVALLKTAGLTGWSTAVAAL